MGESGFSGRNLLLLKLGTGGHLLSWVDAGEAQDR